VTRVNFSETLTASRVCRYSVNHSNVHLIIALTAQSDQTLRISQAHSSGEVGTLCSFC